MCQIWNFAKTIFDFQTNEISLKDRLTAIFLIVCVAFLLFLCILQLGVLQIGVLNES